MKGIHREALLLNGIAGLQDTVDASFNEGLWQYFHRLDRKHLSRMESRGSFRASQILGLDNYLGDKNRISRDSQIGSIGGGNHFVEIQKVERIIDGAVAHAWGLQPGMVTVMIHTGSVSIGQACGTFYRDKVKSIYPRQMKHPDNGIYVLPLQERFEATAAQFWNALYNAANFAFANRMFLGLMAWASLEKCLGRCRFDLLYDAPHNMVWKQGQGSEQTVIHRKGACPARGVGEFAGTPFEYYGEPVLVPGSMGASSFLLAGNGFPGTLSSAAHGVGRSLSRGRAMKGFEKAFREFMREFRVVTPIDFRRQDVKSRSDIVAKKYKELMQEAPFAYKGILPVIDTIEQSGMARPVAELQPLMTIKG